MSPTMASHQALRAVSRAASAAPSTLPPSTTRSVWPLAGPSRRPFCSSTTYRSHENPLGLPRNNQRIPPTMPRRGSGPPQPRRIPNVKHIICVSSGKGGVGKSTISANLAAALSLTQPSSSSGKPRVGLLDLDIFGPSVPKLMGLEGMGEPELTSYGGLIPMKNHGVSCMSMGFLLGNNASRSTAGGDEAVEEEERVVAWRGMMVMKATQQLLFDVDWRLNPHAPTPSAPPTEIDTLNGPLDVLVIDMPPGTGDVALSLAQLVKVDQALIVTTPQEVALLDAKKGVSMFKKTNVPIAGLVLNMSHFISPDTGRTFELFGKSTAVEQYAAREKLDVLARIPLQPQLSAGGDEGIPATLREKLPTFETEKPGSEQPNHIRTAFLELSQKMWSRLGQ